MEANEQAQKLLFKAQVDVHEETGEQDPVVTLIDFSAPTRNSFYAVNQFRVDTPGCVKSFIIPDIVLFVNALPLVVIECKKGGPTCSNPLYEAFIQLQRYMNRRKEAARLGLKEGEPRLFYSNLFIVRTTGLEADFGPSSVFMDTYRLMDAVHDGATLQILYEGRTADTALRKLIRDEEAKEYPDTELYRHRLSDSLRHAAHGFRCTD